MARNKHATALFEVVNRSRRNASDNGVVSAVRGWFRTGDGASPAARTEVAPIEAAPAPPPLPGRRPVSIDPDRAEISLRLSYATAATAVIAILAGLGIAFLAGRKGSAPRPAIALTTSDQLRAQPPQANVTIVADVPRLGGEIEQNLPPAAAGGDIATSDPIRRAPATPRTRTDALNYVIVQSYPDQKTADEARALLAQHGIDCTVEKGLPHWGTPTWFTVVGLEGFSRLSNNPSYEAYVRKIREVSDKSFRKGSFKAFDPKPYKWGRK